MGAIKQGNLPTRPSPDRSLFQFRYHDYDVLSFALLLSCHQDGGVFWVRGNLSILGGTYIGNASPETGGVLFCSERSHITIESGVFQDNTAGDGGVALVYGGASLKVESGTFSGNVANGQGGVFSANTEGDIQVGRILIVFTIRLC